MKIIELNATNVKRLKAVEITPDGTMQVIGGRNAQGKSSVLDAIWYALGGGKAGKELQRPIRDGEERAEVTLDLGDLRVTRTWTAKGTSLKVTNADGASYSSPQSMLDGLVGQLSFDPLAFTRLPAKEQRQALMGLVSLDVDIDALDAERERLYQERTAVGQRGKALGTVTVDDSLPVEEVSMTSVLAEIDAAEQANRAADEHRRLVIEHDQNIRAYKDKIERLEEEIRMVRICIGDEEEDLEKLREQEVPERVDVAELRAKLATVEDTNAAIRANNQARTTATKAEELREEYRALSDRIANIDKQKNDALAAAAFPVPGLGFDQAGVTFNGLPFSQASSAEQIRVSVAMAMALNPKLRVLRIMDGSLLDAEAMAAIREQVAENDFQLWIERVGNADEGAVIIEDGEVVDND